MPTHTSALHSSILKVPTVVYTNSRIRAVNKLGLGSTAANIIEDDETPPWAKLTASNSSWNTI